MKDAFLSATIAERLWAQRDLLSWHEPHERGQEHATCEYPVSIQLPGDIRLDLQRGDGCIVVEMGGHVRMLSSWNAGRILRAWRAVQAWGIAVELGETADPDALVRGRTRPSDVVRLTLGLPVRRWGGQNIVEHLDLMIARRIDAGRASRLAVAQTRTTPLSGTAYESNTSWYDVGDGVLCAIDKSWTLHGDHTYVIVKHSRHGNVLIQGKATVKALDRLRNVAFGTVLSVSRPTSPALPAMHSGNARIARIAMLCREALKHDPDLADRSGTPIRPLVERDLPNLLARHADAARTAPADQLAEVDADLDRGIEIVRSAVEQALAALAERKRDDLATQLRFLEMRHPDA